MDSYKLYVNGRWVNSSSGETFSSVNPADPRKIVGIFQKGNFKDVDDAVESALDAFEDWSNVPAPKRGEILLNIAKILREEKNRLGKLITTEMGKVLKESLGEVQEAIDTFEYMAGEGRRLFGNTTPSELKNKVCMTFRRPIGVVGLITPWNFPIAIPSWKLAPALICGNTVVFKPSSDTLLCAVELVKILEKAGVPKGVVNLVTGSGSDVGNAIIKHKKIRAISFTGSKSVGEFVSANSGLKKVGLELGGKNPIVIMDDADLNLAVDGIVWGGFGTTGQRCTAASRVIIHEAVFDKFVKLLLARVKKLKLGDGLNKNTDVGPLVNLAALEKVKKYVEIGKKEGAKLLFGGKSYGNRGYFFEPTLFVNVDVKMRIAQEEIFGPVVCLLKVKNLNEAIKICNSVEYGLSSSIYTNNIKNAFLAIEKIEAGLTYVNSSTIGSEAHLPFGGVKGSGNGCREAGILGIEEFSEAKTVYIDYSGKLQKAQGMD